MIRAFVTGWVSFAALALVIAELPGIRVTWTHAERSIRHHGRIVASFPRN
jgi:hypothetical protein